ATIDPDYLNLDYLCNAFATLNMTNEPLFQAPRVRYTYLCRPFQFLHLPLPEPPLYEGARDGFKCEAWLTAVQLFFVRAKIAPAEKTLHAIIFLTGTASLWWEPHPLADDAPWFHFVEAFRTGFRPVDVSWTMLQGFEVSNPGDSDLQTLLSTAKHFDNIYDFKLESTTNPRSATSSHTAQKVAPTFTQPDPYAMELDRFALPQ
ncbi:hypothetical protein BGZ70_005658, partial [Mortierella alpina]